MKRRPLLKVALVLLLALGILAVWMLLLESWGVRASVVRAKEAGITRYVAPTGSDAGNDCTSSANPCQTIQHAVDVAQAGDEIRVAAGTYTDLHARPTPPHYDGAAAGGVITQVVYISKSVVIRGGYSTSDWTVSDPAAHQTTLDAQGKGRGIVVAGEFSATIQGVRIVAGKAISVGGGIYVLSATVTLRDNFLYNNTAWQSGGAVYLSGADESRLLGNEVFSNTAEAGGGVFLQKAYTVTIQGNEVHGNAATDGGGMMVSGYTAADLVGNRIHHNRAISTGGGLGIVATSGSAVLTQNLIYNNQAGQNGGGVYLLGAVGYARLNGDRIHDNRAGGVGGGMCAALVFATTDVVDAYIHGNQAGQDGGGAYLSGAFAAAALTGTHFYDNRASRDGGGIYQSFGLGGVDQFGNYVYHNQADRDGGGIYVGGGATDSVNDMVTGNRAGRNGSGLLVTNQATLDCRHATIARNTGGDGSGVHVTLTSTVNLSNTIIVSHTVGVTVAGGSSAHLSDTFWGGGSAWANQANWGGSGTINHTNDYNGDPRFVAPSLGDYHLRAGSDATGVVPDVGISCDIDWQPRPQGTRPDAGADEVPASCIAPTGVTVTLPSTVTTGEEGLFTATVEPTTASLALTYLWEGTGLSPAPHPNVTRFTDTAALTWSTIGAKQITVTVLNACGTARISREVVVQQGKRYVYLPLVLRGYGP